MAIVNLVVYYKKAIYQEQYSLYFFSKKLNLLLKMELTFYNILFKSRVKAYTTLTYP